MLVISQDGRSGSIDIRQDADLYVARLAEGQNIEFNCRPGRGQWLQVVQGRIAVNGLQLGAGDGLSVEDEPSVRIQAGSLSEILLFDLA